MPQVRFKLQTNKPRCHSRLQYLMIILMFAIMQQYGSSLWRVKTSWLWRVSENIVIMKSENLFLDNCVACRGNFVNRLCGEKGQLGGYNNLQGPPSLLLVMLELTMSALPVACHPSRKLSHCWSAHHFYDLTMVNVCVSLPCAVWKKFIFFNVDLVQLRNVFLRRKTVRLMTNHWLSVVMVK